MVPFVVIGQVLFCGGALALYLSRRKKKTDSGATINIVVKPPSKKADPGSEKPPGGEERTDPQPVTANPDQPLSTPQPGNYYQVQKGDVGVRLIGRAYGITIGTGAPIRSWNKLISHSRNRALSPSGVAAWDGQLVARHRAPGQHRRGSGSSFPVVYFPTAQEVV